MNQFQFRELPLLLWATDDDAGSGGGENKKSETDEKTTPEKEPSETLTSPELATRDELFLENTRLKTRISELNRDQSRIRNLAKTSEDDKAELAAFRALGLKPDELKTQLESGKSASARVAEVERLQNLESAAKSLGFKATLLKRLAPSLPVVSKEIDVKDEDGKFTKETKFFFKDGEKETEIAAYFEGDDETLELLKASEDGSKTGHATNNSQGGKKFVAQGGASGTNKAPTGANAILQARLEAQAQARKDKKNPLMR